METVIAANAVKHTSVQSRRFYVIACFFFSTLFFYGGIGKNIASVVNLLSPFILFLIFCSSMNRKPFKGVGRLATFSLISICISFLIVGGGWGSLISNIGIVLLISIFYNAKLSNLEIRLFVKQLCFFHVFLFVYVVLFRYNEGYIGSFNANSIANQSLIDLVFFLIFPNKKKVIQWALIASSIALIVYSNSRTCMGAGVMVGLVYLFRNLIQKRPVLTDFAFWLVIILSIAIPFVYSQIIGDSVSVDDINALSAERFNKNVFTGRELIWASAWQQLLHSVINFLFGIGSHFTFDDRDGVGSNFHSSFFTVVICCGFLGFMLIVLLLHKLFKKNAKMYNRGHVVFYEKMLYVPIMFAGIFESTLLVGNYAIMLYFLLGALNSKVYDSNLFCQKQVLN